uniref:Uncharacterized protein n=1 Tax=Acrobeloides nanus TaxID=290746 RepID=A0A914CRX4_9BILA
MGSTESLKKNPRLCKTTVPFDNRSFRSSSARMPDSWSTRTLGRPGQLVDSGPSLRPLSGRPSVRVNQLSDNAV